MSDNKTYSQETVEILKEITRLSSKSDHISEKVGEIHTNSKALWHKIDENKDKIEANKTKISNITVELSNDKKWTKSIFKIALGILGGLLGGGFIKYGKFLQ